MAICFAPLLLPKFFSTFCIEKYSWKNIFNLYPTSFFCLLHFIFFSVFVLTSPRKINYLSILYGHLQAVLRGCFAKVFYPLTIIGKLRAVCWGISQKFYKKFLLNQGHKNRKVDRIFKNFIFYDTFFRENYPSIFPRTRVFVLQPVYKIFNEFSQKNPCDFGRLSRHDLRTDFYPDYLIFSRFYSKIVSQ